MENLASGPRPSTALKCIRSHNFERSLASTNGPAPTRPPSASSHDRAPIEKLVDDTAEAGTRASSSFSASEGLSKTGARRATHPTQHPRQQRSSVWHDRCVAVDSDGTTLERAGLAFDRGDFASARTLYEAALTEHATPDALDGLGQSLWFLGEIGAGIARREQAYTAYRRSGALGQAAGIALWLVVEQATSLGNAAAANGWFRRAERILADLPLCPAHAELEIHRGLGCTDPEVALGHFRRAADLGRRLGHVDSEVRGLTQLGYLKVALGELEEGMALLDETMTAATSGEVEDPWAIGATCCSMLFACERIADLKRAGEWCRIVFDVTHRRNYVPLSALCRSVYAGVLVTEGQWMRAEQELLGAVETYRGLGQPLAAYPLARLARLRLQQGRIDEAAQLVAGWEGHPEMAVVAIQLLVERGDLALAAARLEHHLDRLGPDSPSLVDLLPLLVRVRLEQGDLDAAKEAAESYAEQARRLGHEHLLASSDLIGGEVAVRREDPDAVRLLEAAAERFAGLGMPYDEARARLVLATAVATREPELAIAECRAARAVFEKLGARREADRTAELLRSLGVAGRSAPWRTGQLSSRECEVLALVEHGLSNREIAERLCISPKTASHHVSQILAKLDLRTRAEAAAYAARKATEAQGGPATE